MEQQLKQLENGLKKIKDKFITNQKQGKVI